MRWILFVSVIFVSACFGQDARPDLSGTWVLDNGGTTWKIAQKDDSIQVNEVANNRTFTYSCPIGGRDCTIQDPEGKATASFWFNGPVLVEMKTEQRSKNVSKYRMKLVDDGKALEVEVTPIVPASGKTEKLTFKKGA